MNMPILTFCSDALLLLPSLTVFRWRKICPETALTSKTTGDNGASSLFRQLSTDIESTWTHEEQESDWASRPREREQDEAGGWVKWSEVNTQKSDTTEHSNSAWALEEPKFSLILAEEIVKHHVVQYTSVQLRLGPRVDNHSAYSRTCIHHNSMNKWNPLYLRVAATTGCFI